MASCLELTAAYARTRGSAGGLAPPLAAAAPAAPAAAARAQVRGRHVRPVTPRSVAGFGTVAPLSVAVPDSSAQRSVAVLWLLAQSAW